MTWNSSICILTCLLMSPAVDRGRLGALGAVIQHWSVEVDLWKGRVWDE